MQRMLLADALKPETTAPARAQVARAWCELEERKRILRMKPKPKDADVSKDKPKKRPWEREPSFIEPGFSETPDAPDG